MDIVALLSCFFGMFFGACPMLSGTYWDLLNVQSNGLVGLNHHDSLGGGIANDRSGGGTAHNAAHADPTAKNTA
jgi:hypothetical protein